MADMLDLHALGAVSPLAGETVARLFAVHPQLSQRVAVGVALLGIASRYEGRLRGEPDPGPVTLDGAEVRRELLYFENTKRPLAADPSITAVDLVAVARSGIRASAARAAFDHTIAVLIRTARTARARRRT